MILYGCSSNRCKLSELVTSGRESGLADLTIEPLPELKQLPPPEENGSSCEEIAASKALYYSGFASQLVLADDSGLEVNALNGAPGIYSARFAGPNATDSENNELLLRRLENQENRDARFVCFVALARKGRIVTTASGTVRGEILRAPRGDKGFGYDPLFFYPPLGRTFAELTADEKFQVSHRGNALRDLFRYFAKSSANGARGSDKIE